ATEEPRVALAPAEGAGAVVKGGVGGTREVGKSEQAGDVGIVHEKLTAEAVDLVGPDGSFLRCGDGVLAERALHLGSEGSSGVGKRVVVQDSVGHLGELP